MKKLIAAAAATVIAVNTTAFAGYYAGAEHEPFNGELIKYEPYDINDLDKVSAGLDELLAGSGNETEVLSVLDAVYDEYIKAEYASTAAQIEADRYFDDERKADSDTAMYTLISVIHKVADMTKEVYESGYGAVLELVLDTDREGVEEFIDSIPTERFYELSRLETQYESEYSKIYGDSQKEAELFLKLAKIRNEIAEECGYDDYSTYAHEMVYGRDYSEEDLMRFYDSVAKELPLLFGALTSMHYDMKDKYKQKTDEELIDQVGRMMYSVNGELGDSYRYMIDNDLYDIECRDGKNTSAGAYTVRLSGKNVPYLFMSESEDSSWRVKTFIHESGHYCSILNTPDMDKRWNDYLNSMSIDTCEIHSQGLELLATAKYGKLFGNDAAYERLGTVSTIIGCVLDGCFFDEWQRRVYAEPDLTVDKANEIAADLLKKYYDIEDVEPYMVQSCWTDLPHNFTSPMYYISYGVSAAAALEIYARSVEDYGDAVDKYMRISAMGGYTPFRDVLKDSELNDIFEESSMEKTAYEIGKSFGLTFIDVDYVGWYAPYLFETSHIEEGRTDELFMPNKKITRTEFVKLIAKMYDYYEGIGDMGDLTMTFKDLDADDETAGYIKWANTNGIVDGYSDEEFGGDDDITREQAVTVLYRLYLLDNADETAGSDMLDAFNDSDSVSDWARDAMEFMISYDIIDGRDDGYIVPDGNTTRAEAAKIAACYIDKSY